MENTNQQPDILTNTNSDKWELNHEQRRFLVIEWQQFMVF
jgi:hypothetical protein